MLNRNKLIHGTTILFLSAVFLIQSAGAFSYNFLNDATLRESETMTTSTSPYFWLNSGAYLKMYGARGHTNEGELGLNDRFRLYYSVDNPIDTDNGFHPQNIFRLITKEKWKNFRQEIYFKVTNDNLSPSPNRDGHNGLLLFNRYLDSDNLYYIGVRVDGTAIIKKKQYGVYTTLVQIPGIYPGVYNRITNPSLIPKNKWIGIRSEIKDNPDGSVNIKLYTDKNWNGVWTKVAEVNDNSNPITGQGNAGIRTDFMDVTMDNYKANEMA